MEQKMIGLSHITKDYGNGKGVFDITFSVKKGEVFGYLGPNGAGKTTTIRQLMGFIRPQKGSCSIMGMDCFKESARIKERLGYLAGELAFMDDMTGEGYLQFMAELKHLKNTDRMKELIGYFELDAGGRMKKMSKGMKQKIGLVTAFMGNPEIVILDEPTSGLDPLMQNKFVNLILEEKKKGTTILMSSHIFEEIERTCDRTAIIRAGRIVDVLDIQALSQKRDKIYVVQMKTPKEAERFAEKLKPIVKSVEGSVVSLYVKRQPAEVLKKIAEANPVDLDIKSQSLEELFLKFYGEGGK